MRKNRKRPVWLNVLSGCLITLLIIPGIHYGLYYLLKSPSPQKVQLIAHRGGLAHAPENTIAAFKHAINTGADWLEFDVQRTKDGVPIVFHDQTIDRTTNGTGIVSEFTFEELRALDAGQGEQIPSLQEVLALAKEANINLLPELKSARRYPNMDEQLIKAIQAAGYTNKTIIQSFNHDILQTLKENHPDVSICPLYKLWELNLNNPKPENAEALCPMAEMVILNPWMIKQARNLNKDIYVWFGIIEKPFWIKVLITMGVDGIMVDDAIKLKEILQP